MLRLYDLAYLKGEHETLARMASEAVAALEEETGCYLVWEKGIPCPSCPYRHVCEDLHKLATYATQRIDARK